MHEVISDIHRWLTAGEEVVLATVVSTWGSSPRAVGAKMAITIDAKIAGSVSGGCVEGAVIESGLRMLQTGIPQLLHFGVADETAFNIGLACGGNIEVYIKNIEPDQFERIRAQIKTGVATAIVTVIDGPQELIGYEMLYTATGKFGAPMPPELDSIAKKLAKEGLRRNQSMSTEIQLAGKDDVRLFTDIIAPQPKLVIIGGVHIAITLSALAKALGYRTVVIDPRKAFNTKERFPQVDELIQAWPEEAMEEIDLSSSTAVAVLTHDPKIDDPAIKTVLGSDVFYVGALGSRKTHQKRVQRHLAAGVTPEQLERLHAPIGLQLGGRIPEETALEIMAQIIAVRNGQSS